MKQIPFLSMLAGIATGNVHAVETPNILVITTDDQGLQLSCYGDPVIKTPHLDALANDGFLFKNAYVTATSCSPSRSSILTGLYPHQNGQIGLSQLGFSMSDSFGNFSALAKDKGYYTGVIGKVHVEPISAFKFDYMTGGFDYLVNGESTCLVDTPVDVVMLDGLKKKIQVQKVRSVQSIEEMTVDFLEKAGDQKFCLYLNIGDPHLPFHRQVQGIPERMFSSEEVRALPFFQKGRSFKAQEVAAYYDSCLRIDEMIGRLTEILRQNNVYENTAIIFVSDHGPNFYGRAKGTLYEGGMNVPMLAKIPGIEGGKIISELISTIDIYPTIRSLLGVPPDPELPGQSLTGLDDGSWIPRDFVFGDFNQHDKDTYKFMRSIRGKKYKLIYNPFSPLFHGWIYDEWKKTNPSADNELAQNARWYSWNPEYELYDLEDDPYEWNNLAENPAHASDLEEMKNALHDWMQKTDDFLINPETMAQYKKESREILEGLFGIDGQGIRVEMLPETPSEKISYKVDVPGTVRRGELFSIRVSCNIPENVSSVPAKIVCLNPEGLEFRGYSTDVHGQCVVNIDVKIPSTYKEDNFSIFGFIGENWLSRLATIGKMTVKVEN